MYKICRVETDTLYTDENFTSYEETLNMALMFSADDLEYDEPPYTYAILNEEDKLVAIVREGATFEISK